MVILNSNADYVRLVEIWKFAVFENWNGHNVEEKHYYLNSLTLDVVFQTLIILAPSNLTGKWKTGMLYEGKCRKVVLFIYVYVLHTCNFTGCSKKLSKIFEWIPVIKILLTVFLLWLWREKTIIVNILIKGPARIS